MKNSVFFDFDGVLIDSLPCMEFAWSHVQSEFNIDNSFYEYHRHIGIPFFEILTLLSIPKHLFSPIKKTYNKYATESVDQCILFPYAISVIDWLLDNQYNIGLVTSKDSVRTYNLLKHFNLPIDVVVTPELTQRGKPFPDPLLLACDKFSIDCSQVVFIGDMFSDMQAAKAAKIDYLHFMPGYSIDGTFPHYGSPIFSLLNIIDFMKYQ